MCNITEAHTLLSAHYTSFSLSICPGTSRHASMCRRIYATNTHRIELRLVHESAGGHAGLAGGRGVRVAQVSEGVDGLPRLQVLRHADRRPQPGLAGRERVRLESRQRLFYFLFFFPFRPLRELVCSSVRGSSHFNIRAH